MNVNSIQGNNTTPSFQKLRVSNKGVARLADLFETKPELQTRFIEKIVTPLKTCNVDVIFDGGLTYFRKPNENYYNSILSAKNNEYRICLGLKDFAWLRAHFGKTTKNPLEYTDDFMEEDFLHNIEAGKNIALHLDTGIVDNISNIELEKWDIDKKNPIYPKYKELLDILG